MLDVISIPAFNDNYIWLLRTAGEKRCWVVDPGDAQPVQRYLQSEGLHLEGILLTHHHPDHIGGVKELATTGVTVIGALQDIYRLPPLNVQVTGGDRFQLLGHTFQVLEVPGHTLGHLAYVTKEHQPPLLFCGDTLFAGGCGRLFEGTAEQMHASLQSIASLPDTTRVYAAHEYTQSNLEFASKVEPGNLELQQRLQDCRDKRAQKRPTLPSTLALEKATNPFLRVTQPSVKTALQQHFPDATCHEDADAFRLLRSWKDTA